MFQREIGEQGLEATLAWAQGTFMERTGWTGGG